MLKDVVFNQHSVGAEMVLITVLGGGHQTKGKRSNRPIRVSLPVPDRPCEGQCPLAAPLGSPEMLRAGLTVGRRFLPCLERERDVGTRGARSCGFTP